MWTVETSTSPAGPPNGVLLGVSCFSTTSCIAVGYSDQATLVEQWNGTNWSVTASPNPLGANISELSGVSCPSATSCFAVGGYSTSSARSTLVEQWNGTTWSIITSPNPSGATWTTLNGVSCPSTTSCYAVGYYLTGSTPNQTLVEHWDGANWSIVTSPNRRGATGSYLSSVACPSTTLCYAVGDWTTTTAHWTLIERWNGRSWAVLASANPSGSISLLSAVSCASTTDCNAVGDYQTSSESKTLIEHWNGTSWAIVTSPNPTGTTSTGLSDVSCASTTSCYAVGVYQTSSAFATLIEKWNGASWTIVTNADPPGSTSASLSGVRCPTTTSCFAVGSYDTSSANAALVEQWNGASWSISPPAARSSQSQLLQVACPSATDCLAVGNYQTSSVQKTLAEHWNGTSWATVYTPNPTGATSATLNGVTCSGATNCFAVGEYATSSASKTLIERWNGTSWSISASPNPAGATSVFLNGVKCLSATSCFAVGEYATSAGDKTLIERWNGTSWAIIASPNPSASFVQLQGVSCPSIRSCNAVGSAGDKTFVEHWNGTSWTIVATPTPINAVAILNGVSCPNTSTCFAVGTYLRNAVEKTLVEHWNGTSWSLATSPNPIGATNSILAGVSCASATNCFAVGDYQNSSATKMLLERWNGTSWAIAATPDPTDATNSNLSGVACAGNTNCKAVGTYHVNASDRTLIESFA